MNADDRLQILGGFQYLANHFHNHLLTDSSHDPQIWRLASRLKDTEEPAVMYCNAIRQWSTSNLYRCFGNIVDGMCKNECTFWWQIRFM
jgi:hypothetical protein